MSVDDEVLAWIREAVAGADSWDSVRSALQARHPEGDDLRLRPFVFASGYTLHERFGSARERAGGPFGPMIAGETWRFPPALGDIADEEVDAWRARELRSTILSHRLALAICCGRERRVPIPTLRRPLPVMVS